MGQALSSRVLPGYSSRFHNVPIGYEKIVCTNTILYRPMRTHGSTLILYSHGNAEDCASSIRRRHAECAVIFSNVVAYEYPGYGELVRHEATEETVKVAAIEAVDFCVRETQDKRRIVAWGYSLGGSLSMLQASRHPSAIHHVVLESAFTSVLSTRIPFAIGCLPCDMFYTDPRGLQHCLVCIIHGEDDAIVPPRAISGVESSHYILVRNAGHLNAFSRMSFLQLETVRKFCFRS